MQSEQQDFPAQDNVLSQKQMKEEGNSQCFITAMQTLPMTQSMSVTLALELGKGWMVLGYWLVSQSNEKEKPQN